MQRNILPEEKFIAFVVMCAIPAENITDHNTYHPTMIC